MKLPHELNGCRQSLAPSLPSRNKFRPQQPKITQNKISEALAPAQSRPTNLRHRPHKRSRQLHTQSQQ